MITGAMYWAEKSSGQFSRVASCTEQACANRADQRSPIYNLSQYFGRIPAYPYLA